MSEIKILKLSLICLIVANSCYYDTEENLYPGSICITANVSYQTTIVPIIQRNCFICHNAATNTSNITLEGYDKLMPYVNNGKLMGAIWHQDGYAPMPQGAPMLLDCDIAKIEQWIAEGAPNN